MKLRFSAVILFELFLGGGVLAMAQDRGVIQCSSTFDRVPSWTSPGSANLVEYLACGQMVSVTGMDRGYAQIQIGGHVAYVEAKYVRMTPARGRRLSQPSSPRSSEPAVSAAEIFVGYSHLNFNAGLTTSRQNANGWEISLSSNFNRRFALELDVSGNYKSYSYLTGSTSGLPNITTVSYYRDYAYLAGPRLNYSPFFVHALFGGDHLSGSSLGTSTPQTGFAGALGGGVQLPINDQCAFRAGLDYAFSNHSIVGGSSFTNNNFRASIGIVFNLGNKIIQ
jgi:hypothetical protein